MSFPNAGQGEVTAIGALHSGDAAVAVAYFPGSGTPQYNETVVHDIVSGSIGGPEILGGFFDDRVDALLTHAGSLYAFGKFRQVGGLLGQIVCNGVARFDGTNWVPIGTTFDTPPLALASWRGDLWAGGAFTGIGGVPTPILAHLVNGVWQAPGGANGPITVMQSWSTSPLLTLTSLVVGGDFTQISGGTIAHIAQIGFTGTTFVTSALGSGLNARPRAIAVVRATANNNDLIVGGEFSASGTLTLNRVGRWTGTAWEALGTGVNGIVSGVTGFGTSIVVGGQFTTAGGSAALRVAAWNPSTSTWSAMGAGFNAPVLAVAVYNGVLYAGGQFTASGTTPINHLARWTGSAWQQAGTGLNGNVFALLVVDADLAIGGGFTADGTLLPLNRFALWNGSSYRNLGNGFDNIVTTLAQNGSDLYASGIFTGYLAEAVPASVPTLQVYMQPVSCLDQPVHLMADTTNCAGGAYHWRRNGSTLSDGLTPSGSIIQGSSTPDLFITSTNHADEGAYNVAINCACGNATSTAISLVFATSPYVILQPNDGTFCIGGPLTLAVLGGGTEPLSYTWTKNGAAIPNGFGEVVVIPIATATDAGTYSCTIGNDCGTIESHAISRTIAAGPTITTQPQPASACVGGQATFTVTASNVAAATYQWFHNNVAMTDHAASVTISAVSGSATPTLHLSQILSTDAGYYQCAVTTACTAVSVEAMLTIGGSVAGDGDGDGNGLADGQDIVGFETMVITGVSQGRGLCAYDMNADGVVSVADLPLFVARLLGH